MIEKIEKPKMVCDIGVEGNHNLFICKNEDDYSVLVHNCWGLASGDDKLIQTFQECLNYIYEFRFFSCSRTYQDMDLLADVHKVNYKNFTGVPVQEVTNSQRQDAKGIVFGSIYGMSTNSLSVQINKPLEETQALYDNFFTTFKRGGNWLNNAITFCEKHNYMYSPIGRRRNLYGNLVEDRFIKGSISRQARNSPIQGMASDLGYMSADVYNKSVHEFLLYAKISDNKKVYDEKGVEITKFLPQKTKLQPFLLLKI
jgi:hypothetical protein